jgi:hypothetical protein
MRPRPAQLACLLLVLALVVLLGASASAADARGLRLTAIGTAQGPLTDDGARFLVFAPRPGAVVAWDLQTGARRALTPPAGCGLTTVGGGAVLAVCPDASASTVDLGTGAVTPLPVLAPVPGDLPHPANYGNVGARWAMAEFSVDTPRPSFRDVYVERATGRVVAIPPQPGHAVDLDAAEPDVRLCRGVSMPRFPDTLAPGGGVAPETLLRTLARSGSSYASTDYTDDERVAIVVLQRCDRPQRVLRTCRRFSCSGPVMDSRRIAWIETPASGRSTLRVIDRRSGQVRTRALGAQGQVVLLRHRMYVSAGGRLLHVT